MNRIIILRNKKIFFFGALLCFISLTSCKSKGKADKVSPSSDIKIEDVKSQNHTWYYFSQDNYFETDKPQNAPFKPKTPWTESVRISSANNTESYEEGLKAYAIVNRLGIMCLEDKHINLCKDANIFNNRSAGNLIFYNNVPIFSVYKSSFFNDSLYNPSYSKDDSNHLFLIQFDRRAKISYPIVNTNNITQESNSEITDFFWDGINWTCSIKSSSQNKNTFDYVKWKPTIPLLSLSPLSANKNTIKVQNISQEEYRSTLEIIDYKKSPERVKNLLKSFSDTIPFYLEVKSTEGISPKQYFNNIETEEKALNAKAILAKSWSCVLFEDGTMFIEGALPGKHILRNGKPVALRLPKLPASYIYSDFVISGTTMYAAWEETDFFQTGRSGFLQIDLDKTLYNKIL